MIKTLFRKIGDLLLPNNDEDINASMDGVLSDGKIAPRQRILNKLKEQFLIEMRNETTTESLLYHTSFTVYIREEEYERLSPSFAQTVRDAVNVFVRELRKIVKRYPNYQNHSKYWEMQLVAIPRDAEIDGINTEILDDNLTIIKSKLFAVNNYDSRFQEEEHCVTTIHTKDSSRRMPDALNLKAINELTELAKDRYRVEFNLSDLLDDAPKSEAERKGSKIEVNATLHIVDGDIISDEFKYRVYNMTGDKLYVSGKNGSVSSSVDEIHINDENILNPTLLISRNITNGYFTLKTYGDVKLGGKKVENDIEVILPHNSSIIINDEYQIDFKTR